MAAKQTTYWLVRSAADPAAAPEWQQLDALRALHEIDWIWVQGNAGHPGNERADELANLGVEEVGRGAIV